MICCLNFACHNPPCPDGIKFCTSCGVQLVVLRNRYCPVKSLGSGGFGKTYLAEDVDKLNEQCVIKQFAPQIQGTKGLTKATELFQQEARQLQQLGEHHQIPTLLAYFEEDNCLYLIQQFIEGQNLLIELQQKGTFDEKRIHELLLDLLNILKYVHQQKVIHRDIKLENIICRSDRKLVLIDFGVSKQLTATGINQPGTMIGSFGYAPLEQMQGGEAYPSSDLYSLGVTCFHLLSGIHPWELWKSQGYGWITNWQQYLKQPVNQKMGQVLDKLLQKDYHQRYQSAKEVLEDLNTPLVSRKNVNTTLLSPQKIPYSANLKSKLFQTNLSSIKHNHKLIKTVLISCASLIMVFGGYKYWQSHNSKTELLSNSQPISTPSFNSQPISTPSSNSQPISTPSSNSQPISIPSFNSQPISAPSSNSQPTPILTSSQNKDELKSDKKVDYTKLQQLLAAGNWLEADKQTQQVMLQAIGLQEGDSISDKQLLKQLLSFPCTDLRTIDNLWKKYSNGQFGFGIQKEIYLSVGGKAGKDYDVEAWKNFGDRTGWRVGGKWIKYGSLEGINFSQSAPNGHLPYEAHLIMGARRLNDLGFFPRIYSCNL